MIGGHFVTLVGYGYDGNSPNPNYLIVHDPASRAGMVLNEYILPMRINSGLLHNSYSGNNSGRDAEGFYKMEGIHTHPGADFGILNGVAVLEMNP